MSQTDSRYDIIVIGSGSAGSVAAEIAASAGKSVAMVEKDTYLGGECPNYACIPTKALIKAAHLYFQSLGSSQFGITMGELTFDWEQVLAFKDQAVGSTGGRNLTAAKLKERGVELIRGTAEFVDNHTVKVGDKTFQADKFVVATGSTTNVPQIEGISKVKYLTNRGAINLKHFPSSMIVIGGGPVGVEFSQIFSALGADVTLLQKGDRILAREEPEISQHAHENLTRFGVNIATNFNLEKVESTNGGVSVIGATPHGPDEHFGDQILIAAGQQPVVPQGLEKIGVRIEKNGIATNQFLQTTLPHIWAAGDVTGHLLFTHTAHHEGAIIGYNLINQRQREVDLRVAPRATFAIPEIASVGETESILKKSGRDVVSGVSTIESLGRSLTDGGTTGLVKIVADKISGEVLGAGIVAPRAGEMIHELALAMKARLSVHVIAEMIHAFPTYSEAILVAAANAESKLAK